ncbi:MAG: hypothetical protein JHC87_06090 [Thermoleophilaceae bacterium]|nr:hypothetical protein [Thermoleophilaceae bacterium]
MNSLKLRQPSPALVVSVIALVFAMSGTGYAVSQINGAKLKKGSVTGNKLKKNTLTGTQVNEAKLEKVPSATAADNAANADKIDGVDSTSLVQSTNLVHVTKTMMAGDDDATLVTNGDISVKLRCENSGGSDRLFVYAATTADGAVLNSNADSINPLNTATIFGNSEMVTSFSALTGVYSSVNGYDEAGFVLNAANTKLITLLEGSSARLLNRGGKTCTYGGTFILETL